MKLFNIPLTVPNILSLYRIVAFPFIFGILLLGKEGIFAFLLCLNLITDILDGLLARLLKQVTVIGAKLDSIADNGTYFLAFYGLFAFKYDQLQPFVIHLIVMIGLFVAALLLSLIKFKTFPSLHLYSWKIGGYLQGIFFFTVFVFDFYEWYFLFMWTWSVLAFLEHIIIQLLIPEMRANAKGLYWILRERNQRSSVSK
jgi:cardiolipin synthase (CMP-forming)